MRTGLVQSATAPLQTAEVTLKELSDQRWEFEFPPNIKGASWVVENKYLLRSKPLAQNKPYRFRCLWRRKLGQNGNNMHSVDDHLFGTLILSLQLRKWLASKPRLGSRQRHHSAWWLASNLRRPLAMKYQIYNQKSRASKTIPLFFMMFDP